MLKMKKFKYILLSMLILGISSCTDDDASIDIFPSEKVEMNATINTPDVTEFAVIETTDDVDGNEEEVATTFSWVAAKGSYNGSILYTLQIDLKGNNFRNAAYLPLEESDGITEVTKEVSFGDINQAVNKVNADRIADGSADPIDFTIANEYEVRVLSKSNVSGEKAFSDKTTISVTAYEKIIVVEPKLFIVGSVQGYYGASNWSPAEGVQMRYIGDGTTKLFEAYLKASVDDQFKFISNQGADWPDVIGNYGVIDGAQDGNLEDSAESGNLEISEDGHYYVQVDIDNLTYKLVKMQWGIIGSATGGWSDEIPMAYDFATNAWGIDVTLDAGELKFRSQNTGNEIYSDGDKPEWQFNSGTELEAWNTEGTPNFQMAAGAASITMTVGVDGTVTATGVE